MCAFGSSVIHSSENPSYWSSSSSRDTHFYSTLTKSKPFERREKKPSKENSRKKISTQQTENQTKNKPKNNRENKRNQESKTKKPRFVVEIVHIWMKNTYTQKKIRCIEAAKLYMLEKRYSINKPNQTKPNCEANHQKLKGVLDKS